MNFYNTVSSAPKYPVRGIISGFISIAGSVLVAAFGAADTARASTQVYIPEYGNGTPMPGAVSFQGGMVAGSIFRATTAVTFNSLGFIDLNADPSNPTPDGLLGSYQVGLWDVSSQQLLASTTVTPDSTLIGQFRYSPIAPTTIPAGDNFIVGALLPENLQDGYLTDMIDVVSNPNVSGTGFGRSLVGATTLSFPTGTTYMGSDAVAIANASDAIVSQVPEPASTTLVALGCLALFWRRRTATAAN